MVSIVGTVRADGTGETTLSQVRNRTLFGPRWSPDGKWIAASVSAFGVSESGGKYMLLVRSDGSGERRLDPQAGSEDLSVAVWTGNDEIIYSQGESASTGGLDIWARNRSTGAERRLTDHRDDDWDPAYSPDGAHLIVIGDGLLFRVRGTTAGRLGLHGCRRPALTTAANAAPLRRGEEAR